MTVFLNGEFVPEEKAVVSVFDRGFLYGDGLFEAMRVERGVPVLWARHLARLQHGAAVLQLRLPFAPEALREFARQLIDTNQMPQAVLRLVLARGVGRRGYSPRGADTPTLVMSLHPAPDLDAAPAARWKLVTASQRVAADDALATIKTCNKLPHILARAEAEARGADDALLLNTRGEITETAGGNFFWIEGGSVCTPPVSLGLLAGVTRATVLELCGPLGCKTEEKVVRPEALARAQGAFVSLSTMGVVAVGALDGVALPHSPLVAALQRAWRDLIEQDGGG